MERDTNQMSQSAALCRSGCGFYGNPSNDGLCSQCYKDALKRKQAAPTTAPSSSPSTINSVVENSSNIKNLINSTTSTTTPSSLNTSGIANLSAVVASSNISAICAQQDSSSQSQVETSIESSCTVEPKTDENSNCTSITTTTAETPKSQKKKKTRCPICRANLGIIGFECRCGGVFCGVHRYAKAHQCTFDYKEHGAEEIRKNNPQVIGEKVQKI